MEIGCHILVCGSTGSGKSVVANRISQCVGVPHIELDKVFWQPWWTKKPLEDLRTEVSDFLSIHEHGWVFDGNYSRLRDLILPLTDTVVWLRLPFRVTFLRLLRRTVIRCWKGEILWGTNRESWRQAFMSRDSLLLFAITSRRHHDEQTRRDLVEIPHQAQVIELHSSKEVGSFLSSISPMK